MKQRKVLILHEVRIVVDFKRGVAAFETKYPVHRTGKNFIRVSGDEMDKYGKGYKALPSRVPVEELGKVSEPGLYDSDDTECVRRTIYFLHDDGGRAIYEIKKAVGDRLAEMKRQMDTLHAIWVNNVGEQNQK